MKQPWRKQWFTWIVVAGLVSILTAFGDESNEEPASVMDASSPSPDIQEYVSTSAAVRTPREIAPSTWEVSPPIEGFQRYENTASGVRIEYPEGWTVQENVGGAVAAFLPPMVGENDSFQDNVKLSVQELGGEDIDLQQYVKMNTDQIAEHITDAKIISSETVDRGGLVVHTLKYSGKQGEYNLVWQQMFTIDGGKAYVFSYTAEEGSFDKHLDGVSHMADSWAIGL